MSKLPPLWALRSSMQVTPQMPQVPTAPSLYVAKDGSAPKKKDSTQKGNGSNQDTVPTTSHAAPVIKPNALLMTCQVLVTAKNGLSAKARALLDAGSSTSFVSKCLAKSLHLRRHKQSITVTGIAGITHPGSTHDVTSFQISTINGPGKDFHVSAVVVPRVTCHLPTSPSLPESHWSHIKGLQLADPTYWQPGAVDLLLGVDIL